MPHLTKFSGTCRYIITDVDLTFLSSDKTLIQANLEAVKRAQDAGIPVAIATGRYWKATKKLVRASGFRGPLVLDNGSTVFDAQNEIILKNFPIAENVCRFFFTRFLAAGFTPLLCSATEYYQTQDEAETSECLRVHDEYSIMYSSAEQLLREHGAEASKLTVFAPSRDAFLQARLKEICAEADKLGLSYHTCFTEPGVAVVNAGGVSKVTGIQSACEFLGCQLQDVAAIGDGDNDKEMLASCGLGFAVSNAIDATRDAATHIVASNDQAGFAQAIDIILSGQSRINHD